jgi:hypothetical protein
LAYKPILLLTPLTLLLLAFLLGLIIYSYISPVGVLILCKILKSLKSKEGPSKFLMADPPSPHVEVEVQKEGKKDQRHHKPRRRRKPRISEVNSIVADPESTLKLDEMTLTVTNNTSTSPPSTSLQSLSLSRPAALPNANLIKRTPGKSKNLICKFFVSGGCKFGRECKFIHSPPAEPIAALAVKKPRSQRGQKKSAPKKAPKYHQSESEAPQTELDSKVTPTPTELASAEKVKAVQEIKPILTSRPVFSKPKPVGKEDLTPLELEIRALERRFKPTLFKNVATETTQTFTTLEIGMTPTGLEYIC